MKGTPLCASLSRKGGVASQIYLATAEGIRVLENGGNAFDAAITVSSILTVLLPNTGGVGGDGFLLALDSGGEIVAYNGSGESSRTFPADEYLAQKPVRGPLTITVPGLVDLWEWVNNNYGSIDLGCLLTKAISLSTNGFYVQESLAQAVESSKPFLSEYEGWNRIFGSMKGGSKVLFPDLAKVYEAIARDGSDAFYRSEITESILNGLRSYGVPMTYEDFAEHIGEKIEPIKCGYLDYDLYELPPNTQGLSTLQLVKATEISNLKDLPYASPARITEFFRLAKSVYEDRDKQVADPRFYNTPVEELLATAYLKDRFQREDSGRGEVGSNDTTFFVVADEYGNLVGFIQSIFDSFGSGVVVKDIPFQSRGKGFAKSLDSPNSPAPRKKPLHTLSILLSRHSGQGDCIIGCAGGDIRPQIHAEVFANLVDYGMTLSRAVEAPRYMLTSWKKRQIEANVEEGICTSELPEWAKRIGYQSPSMGKVHAGRKGPEGVFELVADPRGGGMSAPVL